jgi:hypothetical protein
MAEKAHLSQEERSKSEVGSSMPSSGNREMASLSLTDLQARLNWSADGLSPSPP